MTLLAMMMLACAAQGGNAEPPVPRSIASEPAAAPDVARPPDRATIFAVGDIIPHSSVVAAAGHYATDTNQAGWGALLTEISALAAPADLAIVNLETPVAPRKNGRTAAKQFNAPVAMLDALASAGFDAVSMANNHAWDQGRVGLVETLEHVDEAGLLAAGAGRSCEAAQAPLVRTLGGIRVAWFSTTRVANVHLNREPDTACVNEFDLDRLAAQVRAVREEGAEIVLMSVHWGVEYTHTPHRWDRALGLALLEAGVDVIIGHHPHMLQPFEAHAANDGRSTWVAWSLGNFLVGQGWDGSGTRYNSIETRDIGLLQVELGRDDSGRAVVREARVDPGFIERGADFCLRPSGSFARVHPVRLADARAEVRVAMAARPDAAAALAGCDAAYAERERVIGRRLRP